MVGIIIILGIIELIFISILKYCFLKKKDTEEKLIKRKFLDMECSIIQIICLFGIIGGIFLEINNIYIKPIIVILILFIIYVFPMNIMNYYYKYKYKLNNNR